MGAHLTVSCSMRLDTMARRGLAQRC